jgi:hypothetical protein
MSRASYILPILYSRNNIWRIVQILQLLSMQFYFNFC